LLDDLLTVLGDGLGLPELVRLHILLVVAAGGGEGLYGV
jgi:hypothetical protein